VPTVVDIRDQWPDEIYRVLPAALRGLAPLVFWSQARAARRALRGASCILGVSRTYLEWGLKVARRPLRSGDGMFPHGYPRWDEEDPSAVASAEQAMLARGVDPNRKVFWFVGSLAGSIDIDVVLAAARKLVPRDDIQFVLSGTGERGQQGHQTGSRSSNVVFTGWVERPALQWLSRVACAGIAPYRLGALMSLTNKMYEYMAAGLPIVLAHQGEGAEMVRELRCGLVCPPGNVDAVVSAVVWLADNPTQRNTLGLNGRNAFDREFSADQVYGSMADHLESIAVNGAPNDSIPMR
jgi:glycosyltransferase involved in cell wall biosynthesis